MGKGTWRVAGHSAVVESLARSVDRPAHAYLFLGPARVGKTTMALELAKALNCLEVDRPCQVCSECKLITRASHPDVTLLLPNEKENVVIEQARQLRQEISLFPSQARKRVVIMAGDRLTEPAADALLKTLEEPPEHVVLILTGHELESIPETVVSRCRLVGFGFVAAPDIVSELVDRGIDTERAEKLASLAYGAPGWAIEASSDDDLVARRESMRSDLGAWTGGSVLERLRAAEGLAGGGGKLDRARATSLEELELMITWWRDVLVTAAGQPDLVLNAGERSDLERQASAETVAGALRAIRAIGTAATRIDENVDPRLALEALAVGGG